MIFALASVAGGAVSAHAQTLEEELSVLIESHPQIKAAYKTVASSAEEINKAAAKFLPRVNLSGDYGPSRVDSPTRRATATNAAPFTRVQNSTTLTVTQNLFQGFADESAAKTARLNKLVNEADLDSTAQNVLFQGVQAYIDVLRQLRLVELSTRNEETIQIQLNLEDERVQKGSGITVDVLQAKSRLQLAKERRITFEGNLEDAFTRYTQVFDHPPDVSKMVEPIPPAHLVPETLDDAIDAGLAENPAIANSDRMLEVAREKKREARADLFPSIDLVGTYRYQKDVDAVRGTRRDMSVLLQANWDLFTGLTTRANVAQAAFQYSASKDSNEFTVRKVIEQVKLAWQALMTARERLELLENAVNIASEVFESRKKLRQAGRETVINVLDAESEISNARINYASASFDEKVAVYQLLLAMGRLASPDLIGAEPSKAPPGEPKTTPTEPAAPPAPKTSDDG